MIPPAPHPLDFFGRLRWLDGRPLLDTIEPYRQRIFTEALYSFDEDDRPKYDRVLKGVAKKNNKTTDLILAGLYRFLAWESSAGNDSFILANDEGQAADDLSLAKKLIAVNPILAREVRVLAKEIVRVDGRGSMIILPAGDAIGSHGKTYLFLGYDEIHGYKDYALFEALSPDPTRRDVLTWITSYSSMRFAQGVPLYDLFQTGKACSDPRMYFSWYAADYTTDPDFAGEDVSPEQRANPSMASFTPDYLAQQRARLPSHRFRRLHLNLPGTPDGAALSGAHVMAAVMPGVRRLDYNPAHRYRAYVDMSGGSNDDSTFSIAHDDKETGCVVVDLVVSQAGRPPFNPRNAVAKFAALGAEYHIHEVTGDAYGGQTYRADFAEFGINYIVTDVKNASALYESLEPRLNAYEVKWPDVTELIEQALGLVWRGAKIDHQPGDHDDLINAAAGAVWLVAGKPSELQRWLRAYNPDALVAASAPRPPAPETRPEPELVMAAEPLHATPGPMDAVPREGGGNAASLGAGTSPVNSELMRPQPGPAIYRYDHDTKEILKLMTKRK